MAQIGHSDIVILGAGVIGLTIAQGLVAEGYKVTIVARDLPDDDLDSQAWASPWAGANWSPMRMGNTDERLCRWEKETFLKMWSLIPAGLARSLPTTIILDAKEDVQEHKWYSDLVNDYREIPQSELPDGAAAGLQFNTFSVNPSKYLVWLKDQLVEKQVPFIKKKLSAIDAALEFIRPGGLIINATSMGSRSLVGVQDKKLFPIRGQTILVHGPGLDRFVAGSAKESTADNDHGHTEDSTYIIPRPGDNTALLGGTFQENNWDTSVDVETAKGILKRCSELNPAVKEAKVISHNVGLRPARRGGPRVEAEVKQFPTAGWVELQDHVTVKPRTETIIHAYGFGPAGYQQSWGASTDVIGLVKKHIQ